MFDFSVTVFEFNVNTLHIVVYVLLQRGKDNHMVSQEKQMEVCEVCGAFLIVGDAQTRVDDHLQGKQHMGYARIKSTLEELRVCNTLLLLIILCIFDNNSDGIVYMMNTNRFALWHHLTTTTSILRKFSFTFKF